MTRRLLLPALLLLALACPAFAADGTKYGKGVTGPEIVKISELMAHPDTYVGKTVRVEGLVLDVCPKRGCWMELASDREFESLRIKVDDGVIVFPLEAKGKKAVAEGVLEKHELSVDDQIAQGKHHAEETGKPFDPKSITGPKNFYQIRGTGAVIR